MKSRIIALALAGLAAFPGIAMADTELFGKSEIGIEQALAQRGLRVTGVEEWGQYLRAFVQHADGSTSMIYLDPDTLQQVKPV